MMAPLSKTQYGIYVECVNHSGEICYNLPYLHTLDPTLDADKLCRAIETTVKAHPTLFTRIVLNDEGEPIRFREYVVPPTVWGLCEHLGISRATWDSYCDPRRHPQFRSAAALARDLMQDWSQRALLSRKDVRGLIYILQNAQDQSGEREEETGSLSLSQRRAILEELDSREE